MKWHPDRRDGSPLAHVCSLQRDNKFKSFVKITKCITIEKYISMLLVSKRRSLIVQYASILRIKHQLLVKYFGYPYQICRCMFRTNMTLSIRIARDDSDDVRCTFGTE